MAAMARVCNGTLAILQAAGVPSAVLGAAEVALVQAACDPARREEFKMFSLVCYKQAVLKHASGRSADAAQGLLACPLLMGGVGGQGSAGR